MELTIPTMTKPITGLPEKGLLLWYGPPKQGKSTLARSVRSPGIPYDDPDTIIICNDPAGYEYLGGKVFYLPTSASPSEKVTMVKEMATKIGVENKAKPGTYRHVVLDTLNGFWDSVQGDICNKFQVPDLSVVGSVPGRGNGYSIAYDAFYGILEKLGRMNCLWHFVTHTKRLYLDDKVTGRVPDLTGQLARGVPGLVHSVGFVCSEQINGQLVVSVDFKPNLQSEGGCRIPGWHNRRIILPKPSATDDPWSALTRAANFEKVDEIEWSSDESAANRAVALGKKTVVKEGTNNA